MKKTNLVVVALCSTAMLWCLDRATSTADADVGCDCSPTVITAQINGSGFVSVELPENTRINNTQFPIVQVYRVDPETNNKWEPIPFTIEGMQTHEKYSVVVYGEPTRRIVVVISG